MLEALSLSFDTSGSAESYAIVSKGDDKLGGKKLRPFASARDDLQYFLFPFSSNALVTFSVIVSECTGTSQHPAVAALTVQITMLKSTNGCGPCVYGTVIWLYGIIC